MQLDLVMRLRSEKEGHSCESGLLFSGMTTSTRPFAIAVMVLKVVEEACARKEARLPFKLKFHSLMRLSPLIVIMHGNTCNQQK
jgi:hypothetical protein